MAGGRSRSRAAVPQLCGGSQGPDVRTAFVDPEFASFSLAAVVMDWMDAGGLPIDSL